VWLGAGHSDVGARGGLTRHRFLQIGIQGVVRMASLRKRGAIGKPTKHAHDLFNTMAGSGVAFGRRSAVLEQTHARR